MIPYIGTMDFPSIFFSEKITNIDVINIINNSKDDSAAGIDKITIKLLKMYYWTYSEPTSIYIQLIYTAKYFSRQS